MKSCAFMPLRRSSTGAAARVAMVAGIAVFLASAVPASANEGAKSNGCPWAQDVTLDISGKSLTLNQAVFVATGPDPVEIDEFKVYPLVDQLKLRIVGPKGREWEAALTRLVGGKRCSAFYAGKPVLVSNIARSPDMLILNR